MKQQQQLQQPLYGPFYGTTHVSRYKKKRLPIYVFLMASGEEWQVLHNSRPTDHKWPIIAKGTGCKRSWPTGRCRLYAGL